MPSNDDLSWPRDKAAAARRRRRRLGAAGPAVVPQRAPPPRGEGGPVGWVDEEQEEVDADDEKIVHPPQSDLVQHSPRRDGFAAPRRGAAHRLGYRPDGGAARDVFKSRAGYGQVSSSCRSACGGRG